MPLDFTTSNSPLNFDVYEQPVAVLDKHGNIGTHVKDHKAIVRRHPTMDDRMEVLGIVGSAYKVVQNRDLFHTVDTELSRNLTEDQLRDVKVKDKIAYNGAWCSREYAFINMRYTVGKDMGYATHYRGSDVGFRVIVSHAFDGTSSLKVLSGAIDFYCTNGVITGEFDQFVQRHTSGLALPRIGDRLHASINIFWTQRDVFRKWTKSDITNDVAEELINKLPGMSERRAQLMYQRWLFEAADRGPTVWALFSALTYFSSHNDGDFKLRNTGDDHAALTMHKREMQVKGWVDHPLFKSVAEHGKVIEAVAA